MVKWLKKFLTRKIRQAKICICKTNRALAQYPGIIHPYMDSDSTSEFSNTDYIMFEMSKTKKTAKQIDEENIKILETRYGIINSKSTSRVARIRRIQTLEGNVPCYMSRDKSCNQVDCLWFNSCQK